MKIMTSQTHPIRVDWLPARTDGRVGLTFAPGKHAPSKYAAGEWRRDLASDLDRLRVVHEVDVLVCLLHDEELMRLKIPQLVEEALRRGMQVLRLPIRDGGVPPDPGLAGELVQQIDQYVSRGKRVVVHCAGGLGRAGTIAGCWLVRQGFRPSDAIQALRDARKSLHCPETSAQERFIAAAQEW